MRSYALVITSARGKGNRTMGEEIIRVNVRWHDGYLEAFDALEVRFGGSLLWLQLQHGKNRHIPLLSVRWYSIEPYSIEQRV